MVVHPTAFAKIFDASFNEDVWLVQIFDKRRVEK